MSNKRLSDLSAASSWAYNDLMLLTDTANTASKKISIETLWSLLRQDLAWMPLQDFTAAVSTKTWDGSAFNSTPAWTADTAKTVGDFVRPTTANGYIYEAVATAGDTKTHATTEPVWSTTLGGDDTDDQVTWRCRGLSTIATSSDLSDTVKVGYPLKYTYNSTTYYGLCVGVSSTEIAVAGAPMSSSHNLTALYVGPPERTVKLTCVATGAYGGSVADITSLPNKFWQQADAYLVTWTMKHLTDDTGADQPYVNVEIDGNVVSANGDGTGVDKGAQASTSWATNSFVDIKTANYKVEFGDQVNLTVTVAGSNGDAANLSVNMLFVME
jgi:hypothetical protein